MEAQVNSQRTERTFRGGHDPLDEPEVNAAPRAVLGLSLDDFKNLMRNHFRLLRKRTTVVEKGATMIAALDGACEPARRVLDALTLTLDRARRFAAPFYFDLGEPREVPPPSGLPCDIIDQNWTAYYPCYGAIAEDGHTRVALFSTLTWVNAFAYMLTSRSQIMAQLVRRVRGDKGSSANEVRQLARGLSARHEKRIAAQLRIHGFKAGHSVAELNGTQLACGEIDVVGARVRKGMTEIVVVEAKDLDFPLQKPGALDRAIETLQGGGRQLDKRVDWIKGNWQVLVRALGVKPSDSAVLTPLLVTRRYMPPGVVPGFTVIPYNMLRSVLARLADGNLAPNDGLEALPRMSLISGS